MSLVAVRSALQGALDAISPAIATAWENVPFDASTDVAIGSPYQRVNLLLARPDDDEISRSNYVERGILQIMLCYPKDAGAEPAAARALLIRQAFYRGRSIVSGSVTVTIFTTPEIAPALIEGDRYAVPVSVRFTAPINS